MSTTGPGADPPRSVCHRCGGDKAQPSDPCPSCEFHPRGDDLAVAWLFSDKYLGPDELNAAAVRIRGGARPDPGQSRLTEARRALGVSPLVVDSGPRLAPFEVLLLLLGDLLFTPLVGVAIWFGMRQSRPRAARQALFLTLPVALLLGLLGLSIWGLRNLSFVA